MIMPGRNYNPEKYRFGFNGKEKDDETKGTGNQQDYGMRIYDPRLGRFLTIDPYWRSSSAETPFIISGNSPIFMIDIDGKFKIPIHQAIIREAMKLAGINSQEYKQIIDIQWDVDLQPRNAMDEKNHFDNLFSSKDVYARWNETHLLINGLELHAKNDPNSLILDNHFGRVLHMVQDFYSHSNYIELYIKYYKDSHNGVAPLQDEIPIYDEGVKNTVFKEKYLDKSLKTGAFNLWRWIIGTDRENSNSEGHQHHDELNKDSSESPEGSKNTNELNLHECAKKVALKHTTKILKEKKDASIK